MKRVGLTLAFAVLCATIGTVAFASSASAAAPEIGRCVKVAPSTEGGKKVFKGKFSDHKCTKEAKKGNGHHEWEPEPVEPKTYESPGSSETATLETAKGFKVECKNHKVEGEFTGPKSETEALGLYGCTEGSEPCQTVNYEESPPSFSEGTIVALPLEGELGLVSAGRKPVVGWAIKPKTGDTVMVFYCGTPPPKLPEPPTLPPAAAASPNATLPSAALVTIEGSFITTVKPADRPLEEWFDYNKGAAGKQTPEKFEGGEAHTLKAKILTLAGEESEEAISYSTSEEQINPEEPVEIKVIA
jgi:hypothetical protein